LLESGSINLSNASGGSPSITLSTVQRFNNINMNGTETPSSALGLPGSATVDSFYGNDVVWLGVVAPKAILEIRGLNPARTYQLEFFASRMASDGVNRDTLYRAIGSSIQTTTLNATNNTSSSAKVSLSPNSAGVIRIELEKGPANNSSYGFFYLGNLRIRD
jgi:hypothetical protein